MKPSITAAPTKILHKRIAAAPTYSAATKDLIARPTPNKRAAAEIVARILINSSVAFPRVISDVPPSPSSLKETERRAPGKNA
jgi:hypothetical protein